MNWFLSYVYEFFVLIFLGKDSDSELNGVLRGKDYKFMNNNVR